MCDNTVVNYAYALGYLPDYYKTQKMCDKALSTFSSTIQFVLD